MFAAREKSLIELELQQYWRASTEIRALLSDNHGNVTELEDLKDELEVLRDLSDWASLKVVCMSASVELTAKIADIKFALPEELPMMSVGRPT